jgi:hypothetical protein
MKRRTVVALVVAVLALAAGVVILSQSAKVEPLPLHAAHYGAGAFVIVDDNTGTGIDQFFLNPGQNPSDYRDATHNILVVWHTEERVEATVMCAPDPAIAPVGSVPIGWTQVKFNRDPHLAEAPC